MSNNTTPPLSEVEVIKENSDFLRGTIRESLSDELTGAISPADTNLIKFHGSYQQFDRDLESERKKQKLEPLYSFMIRVRLPGGIATPIQWIAMDDLADTYGNKNFKLTTRQTFQLHGILKRNLKITIQKMNQALMDTIAACGDVNRNVMCNPNQNQSALHAEVYEYSKAISEHLLPSTKAYHEIWLDKEKIAGSTDEEPIYGKTYLPRKFKIAIAIPPYNDCDIFANDIGLIAIKENGVLVGFNVAIGGGMGMTFGNPNTYPRLASVIGYCTKEQVIDVTEKILIAQRELGNRSDRKIARLKYTIDRIGQDAFRKEVENRLGYAFQTAKPYHFTTNGDEYGWSQGIDKLWQLTLFVEGGRVIDTKTIQLKKALRSIANIHHGDFRITGNQNLIINGITSENKPHIIRILKEGNIALPQKISGLRQHGLACVALNTCSLAFAEAERYLPSLNDKLESILRRLKLEHEPIVIRMTGCANGCARPYLGEIGLVGKAPGKYNLYLGAGFAGERLNKLYKETIGEQEILDSLTPIFEDYALHKKAGEHFGDFVVRHAYVKATLEGKDFHL